MRKLLAIALTVFSSMTSATSFNALKDFNHLPAREGAFMAYGDDPELVEKFKSKKFSCPSVIDRSPTESDAAVSAFNQFVEYIVKGKEVDNFWHDDTHKQKRKELLNVALETGSWKAEYFDTMWALWEARGPKSREAANQAFTRLREFVEKGVPIAVYKYADRLPPTNNADRYYLYDLAIDRGNPHAMGAVGAELLLRSKELRPLARDLLECALSLGNEKTYEWLGKLASMEGRELDAYRLWEKGVNEGCERCIKHVDRIAAIRSEDGQPSADLEAIKEYYGFPFRNIFYEQTALSEFKRRLPAEKYFKPSDSEVLQLLKLEQELRRQ